MPTSSGAKLSLKVVMNKKKSKVVFAEANSDVVDVLFSFLTLPLGKIVAILEKRCRGDAPVIGSLTSLYSGLVNLNSSHFCVPAAKQMLLNPPCSFQQRWSRLKLDISESKRRKVYYCQDSKCPHPLASNVCLYSDIAKCDCGKPLNRQGLVSENLVNDADGVFMMKATSFIICDDLRVVPVVSAAFLQTLHDLGITDTGGAKINILSIHIDDVMDLLKYSLISSIPLTDLVIKKTQKIFTAAKPKLVCISHQIETGDAQSRKMILKVFLRKSTNKFLLAVATDEFAEFLFSFLAVSIGGIEYFSGGKTYLKNFDNLYKSITDMIEDKYFCSPCAKKRLLNPKLPNGYISKNQFLPLTEESAPQLTLHGKPLTFKSMKGDRSFMKEQTMYIVSDDLTVTPFSFTSCLSIPNSLGISLSDVTEKDLHVGVEEGLSILEASLSSTTPLTDVLINPMNKERVHKQERCMRLRSIGRPTHQVVCIVLYISTGCCLNRTYLCIGMT